MHRSSIIAPYVALAFSLGFAWFMLAPLVPTLAGQLHASISSILIFVSMYGYAMVVGSIPAGLWAARRGPRPVLTFALSISAVGLLVRALSHTYALFLIGQVLAAIAYPFLIAPIGAVLRMSGVRRLRAGTGMTIGALFLGMGLSALTSAHLSLSGALWLGFALNALVGIWLLVALRRLPPVAAHTGFRVRLTYSPWWLVGFVVSSTSVMFGGITSTALTHLHVAHAEALGGFLSGLTFIGSAVGAMVFGALAEGRSRPKPIIAVLAVLTWVCVLLMGLSLIGRAPANGTFVSIIYFLAGAFGNGWYTLALEEAAKRAEDAGSAGLNTAGYSLASNVGVAILPDAVGPMVISAPSAWLAITAALGAVAVIASLITRTRVSEL
ncbi:MFS transporter [Alicyclobacillus vulcanalis]|uniref:Predicted arabinose efflux permease, MFS family n=1 Tax=Alicyclobacillus vulcanalis TaxID=252246 RepID=A0A1N7NMZ4_9BACL|nr:MFS transporter [Alicyclobacillus vulcanalis]SIS99734.1 Predicted arabinose efflux permease, MFS family [Alicyclobacillus vulcanalis]